MSFDDGGGDCVETSLRPCSRLVAFAISPCDLRLIGDFKFSSFTLKEYLFLKQQKNSHTRGYHHWMINKIKELKVVKRWASFFWLLNVSNKLHKLINKNHKNHKNKFAYCRGDRNIFYKPHEIK